MIFLNRIFFFSFVFSIFLHLLFFLSFSLYVNKNPSPVILSFGDILKKDDLFSIREYKDILNFIKYNKKFEIDYSFLDIPKKAFFSFQYNDENKRFFNKVDKYIKTDDYLIFNPELFSNLIEENSSFKIFISPYGRVIISFPEKLLLDSKKTIVLENYIKEYAFSTKDKFFWTKLEKVLK